MENRVGFQQVFAKHVTFSYAMKDNLLAGEIAERVREISGYTKDFSSDPH